MNLNEKHTIVYSFVLISNDLVGNSFDFLSSLGAIFIFSTFFLRSTPFILYLLVIIFIVQFD